MAQTQSFQLWPVEIQLFASETCEKVSSQNHQIRVPLVHSGRHRGADGRKQWVGDKVLGPTERQAGRVMT